MVAALGVPSAMLPVFPMALWNKQKLKLDIVGNREPLTARKTLTIRTKDLTVIIDY